MQRGRDRCGRRPFRGDGPIPLGREIRQATVVSALQKPATRSPTSKLATL